MTYSAAAFREDFEEFKRLIARRDHERLAIEENRRDRHEFERDVWEFSGLMNDAAAAARDFAEAVADGNRFTVRYMDRLRDVSGDAATRKGAASSGTTGTATTATGVSTSPDTTNDDIIGALRSHRHLWIHGSPLWTELTEAADALEQLPAGVSVADLVALWTRVHQPTEDDYGHFPGAIKRYQAVRAS